MMTRKDYQEFAEMLRATRSMQLLVAESTESAQLIHDSLKQVAENLCVIFKKDNPAFNKERFMTAAGF